MKQDFLELQKNFHKTPESKRFVWQTTHPYILKREQELLSSVSIPPSSLALELGCGEGANIFNFRRLGLNSHIIGMDYSPEKVSYANISKTLHSQFLAGNITRTPFKTNSFDFVFCRDVFHHILLKKEALQEIARVVRPMGKVVLMEGNILKLTNRVFSWVNAVEKGMKESSPKKFENLINNSQSSLKIMEIKMAEPSNFFRFVFHYSMGIPSLANSFSFVKFLSWIENIQTKIISQKKWAYMIFTLENRK